MKLDIDAKARAAWARSFVCSGPPHLPGGDSTSATRWTEEEVGKLSESDTRVLMQMATLRSSPYDLFIIRWCTAHLRKLQDAVE